MLSLPSPPSPVLAPANANSFLLCSLEGTLLGLDALAVSEIVPLPAIAPVAQKLPGVQGVLNLRGNIVPVLDLRTILGFAARAPRATDRLVVLQHETQVVALPVDEVHDVQSIDAAEIELGRTGGVVAGLGRVGDSIVQLLRLPSMFRFVQPLAEFEQSDNVFPAALALPSWNITPEEEALFHARATALARPLDTEGEGLTAQSLRHLAVVKLGKEYFGLDLRFVREFAPLQLLTPVPCSPSFVLGLVNLRGEILTLVDAKPSLGLEAFQHDAPASASFSPETSAQNPAHSVSPGDSHAQIVVVEDNQMRLGLAVDEVVDVYTVKNASFAPAPSAAREEGELIEVTVLYGTVRVSVLELSKLINLLLSQSDTASVDSIW